AALAVEENLVPHPPHELGVQRVRERGELLRVGGRRGGSLGGGRGDDDVGGLLHRLRLDLLDGRRFRRGDVGHGLGRGGGGLDRRERERTYPLTPEEGAPAGDARGRELALEARLPRPEGSCRPGERAVPGRERADDV